MPWNTSTVHGGWGGSPFSSTAGEGAALTLDDYTYLLRLEAENASRHVVTTVGDAQLDGNGAVVLDGTGDWTDVDSFGNIASGDDFTFQGYFNFSSINTALNMVFEYGNYLSSNGIALQYAGSAPPLGSANVLKVFINGGTSDLEVAQSISTGTWYHLAVIRYSGTLYLCLDGVVIASAANSEAITGTTLRIGADQYNSGSEAIAASVARFKVSTSADWSSFPFTPPARTSAITVDANTALALDFDGDAASTHIVDSASPDDSGAVPILPDMSGNENDAVQATGASQPLYNDTLTALVFDGLDDYLAGTLVRSQPFTLYMVANITADTVAQTLFGDANANMGLDASEFFTANAGSALTDSNDRSGAKSMFAVEFNGSSSYLYLNGARVAAGDAGAGALAAFGLGARNDGNSPTAMDFYGCFVTPSAYNANLGNLIITKYGV